MSDQRPGPNDLEEPEQIQDQSGERADGRPTGEPDEHGLLTRHAPDAGSKPTIAPEELGKTPSTEHAPGADL